VEGEDVGGDEGVGGGVCDDGFADASAAQHGPGIETDIQEAKTRTPRGDLH
jgi:hypothetical protein